MKSRDAHLLLALAVGLSAGGCASLRPLDAPPESREIADPAAHELELRPVEGRPQGLVLELAGPVEEDAVALSLFRVVGDGDPEVLQTVPIDSRLRQAISSGGVELVDRKIPVSNAIVYQLAVVDADETVSARSGLTRVTWEKPPSRPAEVVVAAPFVDAVELRWATVEGAGAIIFRRDVLAEDSRFERVATLPPTAAGIWVDRDVTAAGVWSYRIAHTLSRGDFLQIGELSEDVYASTPEAR